MTTIYLYSADQEQALRALSANLGYAFRGAGNTSLMFRALAYGVLEIASGTNVPAKRNKGASKPISAAITVCKSDPAIGVILSELARREGYRSLGQMAQAIGDGVITVVHRSALREPSANISVHKAIL